MAYFFKQKEIKFAPHPRFSGVKWALLIDSQKSTQVSVSLLAIDPGVEIPIHVHDQQVDSIYVLEGKGQAYLNGNWEEIEKGDYILVPVGEEHGVKNTGKEPLKLFIVHSPPLF